MLNKVEARTVRGSLLSLPLQDISNGFIVESIEGLDPVNATLVSSSFANLAGEQFQAARREKRNIVIKFSIRADYVAQSVRQLRNALYNFFMPKTEISLRFYLDDEVPVDISGRVENFVAPLFVKEPEVSVSIICFDPDFVSTKSTETSGFTVSDTTETIITYPGNIETGFTLTLNVDRTLTAFSVYNRSINETSFLDFQFVLQSGDQVVISTIPGEKGAKLIRNGVESSILYGVSPFSDWIQLYPGDNNIRVFAEGAAIPFFLDYTTKFGGL